MRLLVLHLQPLSSSKCDSGFIFLHDVLSRWHLPSTGSSLISSPIRFSSFSPFTRDSMSCSGRRALHAVITCSESRLKNVYVCRHRYTYTNMYIHCIFHIAFYYMERKWCASDWNDFTFGEYQSKHVCYSSEMVRSWLCILFVPLCIIFCGGAFAHGYNEEQNFKKSFFTWILFLSRFLHLGCVLLYILSFHEWLEWHRFCEVLL